MPKFTAFAARRIWEVTSPTGTPKTWAAVTVWKSSPVRKASIMCSSPEMWARSLSSIWL